MSDALRAKSEAIVRDIYFTLGRKIVIHIRNYGTLPDSCEMIEIIHKHLLEMEEERKS